MGRRYSRLLIRSVLCGTHHQDTLAVLLHITDVAEVLLVQVQSHGLLVTVGRTSYQTSCNISLFHLLYVIQIHFEAEQLLQYHQVV